MDLLAYRKHEKRPWGSFERFTKNEPSTVKIISVKPGKRLSLQKHTHRNEFWYIISGNGTITIGEKELQAKPNNSFKVPAYTLHRISAGHEGISLLEIAFGSFDENDIERIEDDFGRTTP